MEKPRHVIVVHYAPFIVDVVDMVLSMQGFTVHSAVTFREAMVLLSVIGDGLVAVVAHADMPKEPKPGTLLGLVRKTHPDAGLVVLSARAKSELGPLPRKSVFLHEPFDRAELMAALNTAASARQDAAEPLP
jgi:DNA-binding NtrC family response regulator